jgi:hypothetical protein
MPDQAELDRLMAQATGGAPAVPPDPNLLALAQDAVTANQPLPGAVPAGVAAPAAPDPVDAALAAAQAPAAAPGAPGEAAPLARQIPNGDAQVAPGTSLGAEGPVMTPQDAGAPPVAKWAGADAPAAGAPVAAAPPALDADVPAPIVGSHGVSFKEAGRQLDRAEASGQKVGDAEIEAGKVAAQVAEDTRQGHLQKAEEIRRQVEDRQIMEKARNEGVAHAQHLADEADKKLANFSYHDYFGTHKDENGNEVANPGGNKTLARVFSFISGFNVGAYGAPDIAYRNISKGIEMDMQRQKAELALAQDRSSRTRENAKDTSALFDQQLAMLDLKHAALLKATGEEAEAFAMQKGGDQEMARARVIKAKTDAEYAQKHAEGVEKLAQAHATLAMAGAHLQLARQTAADNNEARAAALQDKKDARADKTQQTKDALLVRDPVTGDPIGYAPTPRALPAIAEKAAASAALNDSLNVLKTDIEQNGHIMNVGGIVGQDSDAAMRRKSLIADVIAKQRKAADLGVSDANINLEHDIVGKSGVGLTRGTNTEIIDHLIEKNRKIAGQRLRAVLTPLDESKDPVGSFGDGTPKAAKGGAAPAKSETPAPAAPDLLSLALQAVDDPEATPNQKANAKQLIIQAKKDGRL